MPAFVGKVGQSAGVVGANARVVTTTVDFDDEPVVGEREVGVVGSDGLLPDVAKAKTIKVAGHTIF